MGLTLHKDVTFCRTGGFTFFLDIGRDRYCAIGGDADAGFARIVAGAASVGENAALIATLARDGLVVETRGLERPEPCRHAAPACESALDRAERAHLKPPMLVAMARILASKTALRHAGLAGTLRRLEARKAAAYRRDVPVDVPVDALPRIAAAFERCNLLASPLDQCLPRSIAVAHRVLDAGLSPTLLIGVRAQPFAAHCWVECGGLIVNDRHDTVRTFTPILIL